MDELAVVLETVPVGVALLDLDGTIRRGNLPLARLLAADEPTRVAGRPLRELVHADDVAGLDAGLERLRRGGGSELELRLRPRGAAARRARLRLAPVPADGQPTGGVVSVEELPHDEGLTARLGDLEDSYRELVEQVPAVVYSAGADLLGRWEYVSPQVTSLLGVPPEPWTEHPGTWSQRLHPDDREAVIAGVQELIRRGRTTRLSHQYRLLREDGRTVWVRDDAVLEVDERGGATLRGVWTDITREKELEARLEHQALHDALTGLANRELLMDRVAHRLRGRSPAERSGALLVVDLDGFTAVNQRHGHHVGDAVLCSVAERLRETTRPADTLARTGGDDFVVLLEAVDQPLDMVAATARVHAALQRPYHLEGVRLELGASIGTVDLADVADAATALSLADEAVRRAKLQGRGRVVHHEPGAAAAAPGEAGGGERDLHADFADALERGGLRLLLQPVVCLDSGELRWVEPQVGWQHPELGSVDPDTVRLLAREPGVRDRVEAWLLEQATAWLATARSRDRARGVGLLLPRSARWLRHPALPAELPAVLGRHGLQARDVMLLVAEGALVSGPVRTGIRHLRERGHGIAIGDFGTGYASLAPLAEGGAELLRLDARLVADLELEGGQTLPATLLQLAGILGVPVAAAGVDTAQQAHLLQSLGCRFGQGDWLAPPQPAAQLEAVLDAPLHSPLGRPHPLRAPR